eukprot:2667803-Karenia_brevis.AAC.1
MVMSRAVHSELRRASSAALSSSINSSMSHAHPSTNCSNNPQKPVEHLQSYWSMYRRCCGLGRIQTSAAGRRVAICNTCHTAYAAE